jgi:hypothetical protein
VRCYKILQLARGVDASTCAKAAIEWGGLRLPRTEPLFGRGRLDLPLDALSGSSGALVECQTELGAGAALAVDGHVSESLYPRGHGSLGSSMC